MRRAVALCAFWLGVVLIATAGARAEPWLSRLPPISEGGLPRGLVPGARQQLAALDSADAPPDLYQDYTDVYCEPWSWQVLPQGLIYRTYLASVTAPRLGGVFNYEQGRGEWVWDLTAGARVGVLRYGTTDSVRPEGWQLDVEGAAFPRLWPVEFPALLEATDYRFGIPLSFGRGPHQFKLAYFHLSSHLGDEFALLNGGLGRRIEYGRDTIVLGYSVFATDQLRLYGETSYAFASKTSKEWQFQFGVEYSQLEPTGLRGVPFLAANAHLRQEIDFGGNIVLQTGWQWTSDRGGRRLRIGAQYYNGGHEKYQFFDKTEQKCGIGIWYDF